MRAYTELTMEVEKEILNSIRQCTDNEGFLYKYQLVQGKERSIVMVIGFEQDKQWKIIVGQISDNQKEQAFDFYKIVEDKLIYLKE